MKKITIAVVSSAFLASTAIPARANDELLRLGIGVGAALLGEALKNRNSQPQPQRTAPAQSSRNQAVPRRQPVKPHRVPDEDVRYVQQRLRDLGYTSVGSADGFWGRNTAAAVAAFMADNALQGDATISRELVEALKTAKHRDFLLAEVEAAEREAAIEASLPPSKVNDGIVHFEAPPPSEEEAAHIERELAIGPEDFIDDAETVDDVVINLESTDHAKAEVAKTPPAEAKKPEITETLPEPASAVDAISVGRHASEKEEVNGLIISSDF